MLRMLYKRGTADHYGDLYCFPPLFFLFLVWAIFSTPNSPPTFGNTKVTFVA